MQSALHTKATILPGHQLSITLPECPEGEIVDVFVVFPDNNQLETRSVMDILNELPGKRLFKTSQEVDQYLQEERNA